MSQAYRSTPMSPISSARIIPRSLRRFARGRGNVLDGLLNHQSGLQIEEHYTDTGGATDHVFGLCHVLGFRFAPRLRDIKDRRLYLFPGSVVPPILAPLVGGFVDADHIAVNWSEVLRLATSIRSGAVQASAMLKKLSGYPRQNGLAVALRDI